MAENITVVMNKGDLQPLANDIKTLNGLSQSDLVTLNEMEKAIEDANDAVDSQEDLIAQISAALEGKAAGGGGSAEPVLQEKTVSPSTSQQNVTPDSGYDGLSKVTVNAMPAGSVVNPSISVSSSGLITATTAVNAGYVDGTDKTGTKQLTTQAAKTITPTKSSQTAVASGRYTTGAVTVAAIPSAYQDVTGVDAVAVDVVEGKKIVNSSGATVTGTNPYVKATTDNEVNSQSTKLAELKTILEGKAAGGGGSGGSVETCTVTYNIQNTVTNSLYCNYIALRDGVMNFEASEALGNGEHVFNDVVKPSIMHFGLITAVSGGGVDFLGGGAVFVHGDGTATYIACFAADTLILLADGSTKPVQDITYDDLLLVWDFDNGCRSAARPLWIKQAQTASSYYLCTFEDGTVLKLVGSNGRCHRVFSLDRNMFESATECVGERIMTNNGVTRLISCERIEEEVEFYNIITHTHLNLYAENILTSCRLNNIYPIENMRFVKENRVKKNREDYPNIGSDMFRGLRIAEQTMSKEEIDEYVSRLYALMDYKMKYYLFINNQSIVMDEKEYHAHFGEADIRQYVSDLYHSRITADEIPADLRERVIATVGNRVARFGTPEEAELSDTESLNIITGGDPPCPN